MSYPHRRAVLVGLILGVALWKLGSVGSVWSGAWAALFGPPEWWIEWRSSNA